MDSLHPFSIESLTSPRKMARLSSSDYPLSPGPLTPYFPFFAGSDPLALAIQQLSPLGPNLNGSTGSSLNSSTGYGLNSSTGSSLNSSSCSSEGLQLSLYATQPVSPPASSSIPASQTSTPVPASTTPSPPPAVAQGSSPDCDARREPTSPDLPSTTTKCAPAAAAAAAAAAEDSKGKPPHSYIALISKAILSHPENKMVLCDIYNYIKTRFAYYDNEERAWRNSIRHNLSLNECFMKAGRAENGKGNYWAIHPACVEDFAKGDYRRRHARRRARNTQRGHFSISSMPYNVRRNLGYVPMTSNAIASVGYHPYASPLQYLPSPTAYQQCAMATPTATPSGQLMVPSGAQQSVSHPSKGQMKSSPHMMTMPAMPGSVPHVMPSQHTAYPPTANTSHMNYGTMAQYPSLNHVAPNHSAYHTYSPYSVPSFW